MRAIRINYLVLAHRLFNFRRLLSRLTDENAFIYVHIDTKSNIDEFRMEASDFSNVNFISKRENVIWGDISIIRATLNLIDEVIEDCDANCYNVLMSGSDYPIKSNAYIRKTLTDNYGKIFLSSRHVKEIWGSKNAELRLNHYNLHPFYAGRKSISINFYNAHPQNIKRTAKNCIELLRNKRNKLLLKSLKKRIFPKYLTAYGGSQWWALPMDVLTYIVHFIERHPDYLAYHNFTHIPDEIFFHSIISSHFSRSRIAPSITHVNWSTKGRSSPKTFSQKDFKELKNSPCLFARKFDDSASSSLLDTIDEQLLKANTSKSC